MVICIGIICLLVINICGCGGAYKVNIKGYTLVQHFSGVEYEIPEKFLTMVTTISEISDDTDYSQGGFLYKDDNSYLLFSAKELIVSVQSGTEFNFNKSDNIEESIQSHSVNNVWLLPEKKEIKYSISKKKDVYKLTAKTLGNVSITPEVYGKYVGKFACIEKGNEEYSIFVGVIAENNVMTTEQKKVVDNIIASFRTY